VCKLIKRDKANYQHNLIEKFKDHPKQFYGYMRSTNTVKTRITVITKQDGTDTLTTTDSETASVLCDYFSSRPTFVQEDDPLGIDVAHCDQLPTIVINVKKLKV